MSPWGWRPARTLGIWRHGAIWLRPVANVAPWVSFVLCCLLMYVVSDSLTVAKGVLFDLPDSEFTEGADTSLVALVMPLRNETTVFFDDARYALEDGVSATTLREHVSERLGKSPNKTMLVLADRRVPCDDLMRLSFLMRESGVERVLFADKQHSGDGVE